MKFKILVEVEVTKEDLIAQDWEIDEDTNFADFARSEISWARDSFTSLNVVWVEPVYDRDALLRLARHLHEDHEDEELNADCNVQELLRNNPDCSVQDLIEALDEAGSEDWRTTYDLGGF